MDYRSVIDDIIEHLKECTDFYGFDNQDNSRNNQYYIKCSCGHSWYLEFNDNRDKLKKQIDQWVQGANMFAYNLRENARQNSVDIDEIICPILGFCLGSTEVNGTSFPKEDIEINLF